MQYCFTQNVYNWVSIVSSYFFPPVIENQAETRRKHVKSLIESLQQEDLNSLVAKLKEENNQENPLLLAAEYGSYKILKSIVELGDDIENRDDFTFDDCNDEGENVLHLRKF